MRNLIGSAVLFGLLFIMWRVWPNDALSHWRGDSSVARDDRRPAAADAPAANPLRVLFVGNSHTHANDMPRMIGELAHAAGDRPLEWVMEAPGGADLAKHLADGRVREHLRHGPWHYVVLQEQQQFPSYSWSPPKLEQRFFAPARTLDVLVRAAGAKTVFYMTWARRDGDRHNLPDDTYEQMQERTREGYTSIARELGAALAPVGVAWRAVRRERPDLALWAEDGSHASPFGSYLAASVLYTVLYGRSPVGIRYGAGLPEQDARLLQRAANAALHAL